MGRSGDIDHSLFFNSLGFTGEGELLFFLKKSGMLGLQGIAI
jgi:hypothetical protein